MKYTITKITFFLVVILIAISSSGCTPKDPKEKGGSDISATPYEKKVLLEMFTSEYCLACPVADQFLETILKKEGVQDKVVRLSYHNCYKTDFLSLPEFEKYSFFYGKRNQFNPAVMLDRSFFDMLRESGVIIDVNSYTNNPYHPRLGFVPLFLKPSLEKKSPIKFTETKAMAKGKNFEMSVKGEISPNYSLQGKQLFFTAVLKKNNIPVKNAPENVKAHNNVVRMALTNIKGEPLSFQGNKFEIKKEFTYKEELDEDFRIVCFVHYFDENDLSQNNVLQTEEITFELN